MTRLITGLVLVACVLALLFLAPPMVAFVVVAVIAFMAYREYAKLVLPHFNKNIILGLALWASANVLAVSFACPASWGLVVFSGVVIPFIIIMTQKGELSLLWPQVTLLGFGFVYLVLPLGLMGELFRLPTKLPLVLLLACTVLGDTLAYTFGRLWGDKLMAPRISPKKTRAGFWGALTGGALGGVVVTFLFMTYDPYFSLSGVNLQKALAMNGLVGIVVAGFGILGDLSESVIKRAVGVKDSGNLLPGHGGVLDRIDAFLFTIYPVYAVTLPLILAESAKL